MRHPSRYRRFLALSLLLHAALLGAYFLRGVRVEAPPEAVMVDLPEVAAEPAAPAAPAARLSHSGSPARATPRPLAPALPLSALAPVHRPNLGAVRPGELAPAAPAPDAFSPYAASEDVLKSARPEETGALAWVYRKAQLTIGYPEAFVKHDIMGNAEARLVFDRSGRLKPELLHVRADSPYLKVYVHRVLESTFTRESIPANLVRWPDTLDVFCYVKFTFQDSMSGVKVTAASPIVGNKLFFERGHFKPSDKLSWSLGPLHGLLPVPMVGMDMTWFYRQYDEHKHPLRTAAEADDLAQWRKDPLFYD